jgi:acyl dehydratase
MPKLHYEDCRVGDEAVTPGRTITETDVVQFAGMTGDWTRIHTDEEYARATPYGGRVAHGMLVLSVGSALLLRAGLLPEETLALYGIEKVRFLNPTRLGDTIHTEGEVTALRELDATRGLVTVSGRVLNQRGETLSTFAMRAVVARAAAGNPDEEGAGS